MNKRVCIFCASSAKIPNKYTEAAAELADLLVSDGWGIVYGGGSVGLMGTIADTALRKGGEVIGVIPTFMVEVEWEHKGVKDMRQTVTMAERKHMMMELSDAILVLPGSTGTMDEFFEAMADKKLGLHNKPLVLLNTDGFYDPTIKQLHHMVEDGFMTERHLSVLNIARTPIEAVEKLKGSNQAAIKLIDAQV